MKSPQAVTARLVALSGLVLVGACQGPSRQELTTELEQRVQELTRVSAEKDSLLTEVAANIRLMSDINTELASVRGMQAIEARISPETGAVAAEYRDSILTKIKNVTTRVNRAEARLRQSEARARSLADSTSVLQTVLADIRATLENQREQITQLSEEMNTLRTENAQLLADKTALQDTVTGLVRELDEQHMVYYVIGTKDELLDKGVVVEEGSKFLFFGSKVLQPARDLDESLFVSADMRQVGEIQLPEPEREYKIASRQNLAALESVPEKDGKIRGAIRIAAPEEFWAPSRYLIVVRQ